MNRLVALSISLALCAPLAWGQQIGTARIRGTVVDTAGGAIPNVQITIANASSTFKVVSDENGKFQIDLPPGAYEVRSDKRPGFATTHRNLTVAAGKTSEITIVPAVSMDDAICILYVTSGPLKKPKRRKRHR